MRSIEHPGPVHPVRVQCVPARVRPVDVELPRGVTLLQGLADAVRAQGATSAVFSQSEVEPPLSRSRRRSSTAISAA